jgi:membrane protease YdiL (CAAX protease family)
VSSPLPPPPPSFVPSDRRPAGVRSSLRASEPWPPWPWWFAPIGLIGGYALSRVAGWLAFDLFEIRLGEPFEEALFIGSFAVVAVGLAATKRAAQPSNFGIRAARPARAGASVFLGTSLYFVFELVWWAAMGLPVSSGSENSEGYDGSGSWGLIFALLVVGPVGEEFFFRGFAYAAMRTRLGASSSIVITASVFGIVHVLPGGDSWAEAPVAIFGGLVLCVVYEFTRSILPCIAIHTLVSAPPVGVLTHHPRNVLEVTAGLLFVCALLSAGLNAKDHRPDRRAAKQDAMD